ncbi:Major sperm protein [Aphelenchoides besseyi]|nr:Major sperm protein [Aphelenchoides besseyi]
MENGRKLQVAKQQPNDPASPIRNTASTASPATPTKPSPISPIADPVDAAIATAIDLKVDAKTEVASTPSTTPATSKKEEPTKSDAQKVPLNLQLRKCFDVHVTPDEIEKLVSVDFKEVEFSDHQTTARFDPWRRYGAQKIIHELGGNVIYFVNGKKRNKKVVKVAPNTPMPQEPTGTCTVRLFLFFSFAFNLSFIAIMASVAPGDINTQPASKIVFNAPYDDKHTYHIKIINSGGRRIGWAIKTTNMKRLGVDPPCGVLDPKEAVLMAVSCDSFQFGQEDTNNDRITIEWTNTPDGAAKQFRREWFQGDGMVRRKNLPIEYNP